MRTIGVVTVARSDFGILLPLLKKIKSDPDLKLYLIVSGMHLSPEFGLTYLDIENHGFQIDEKVEMNLSSHSPEGIAKATGLGIIGFAQIFSRFRPDILIILGDRFEMFSAASAALPFKIPIAHIHGGEVTYGAFDDSLRHSITKLSHIHFATTYEYSMRICKMGEYPSRIFISGAPGLENLNDIRIMEPYEIEQKYKIKMNPKPLLITFHPVTLEYEQTEFHINELLKALDVLNMPVVFTMPNADTYGRIIIDKINKYVKKHSSSWIIDNFGTQGYFSMMTYARAMVGNSSSGMIESASFRLPVINIGNRQKGRIYAENVINTGYHSDEIINGLKKVLEPSFKESLKELKNPYYQKSPSNIIVNNIKKISLDEKLIIKKFYDKK